MADKKKDRTGSFSLKGIDPVGYKKESSAVTSLQAKNPSLNDGKVIARNLSMARPNYVFRARSNPPQNLSSFISENHLSSPIWYQRQWLTDQDLDILAIEMGLSGKYVLIGNQTSDFQQMASSVKPCQVQIIEDHIRTRINSISVSSELKKTIDNLKTDIEFHTTNVAKKNIAIEDLFRKQLSIIGEYQKILKLLGFDHKNIESYINALLEPHPDPYYQGKIYKIQSLKTSIDIDIRDKPAKHHHFLINTGAVENLRTYSNAGNHWVRATISFDEDDPLKAHLDYDDSFGCAPSEPLFDETKKLFPHGLNKTYSKRRIQNDGHNCGKYAMMSLFKKCQVIEGHIEQTYVQGDSKGNEPLAAIHRPRTALRPQERPNPNLNFEFRKGDVALNPVYNDTYLATPKRSYSALDPKADESAMRVNSSLIKDSSLTDASLLIVTRIFDNINKAKAQLVNKHIDKTSQDIDDFIMRVIEFAQQEGGVGNAGEAKWNDFTRKKPVPEGFTFDDAKRFSFHYQQVAKESGVYTGREENLKTGPAIGARLKRIPEDLNQFIKAALESSPQTLSLTI